MTGVVNSLVAHLVLQLVRLYHDIVGRFRGAAEGVRQI